VRLAPGARAKVLARHPGRARTVCRGGGVGKGESGVGGPWDESSRPISQLVGPPRGRENRDDRADSIATCRSPREDSAPAWTSAERIARRARGHPPAARACSSSAPRPAPPSRRHRRLASAPRRPPRLARRGPAPRPASRFRDRARHRFRARGLSDPDALVAAVLERSPEEDPRRTPAAASRRRRRRRLRTPRRTRASPTRKSR